MDSLEPAVRLMVIVAGVLTGSALHARFHQTSIGRKMAERRFKRFIDLDLELAAAEARYRKHMEYLSNLKRNFP